MEVKLKESYLLLLLLFLLKIDLVNLIVANNIRNLKNFNSEIHLVIQGNGMQQILSDSFNDVDFTIIPYLFKRICCLDIDDFNMLFNEVFAKTKRGKQLMFYLCQKAKNDSEYDKFVNFFVVSISVKANS